MQWSRKLILLFLLWNVTTVFGADLRSMILDFFSTMDIAKLQSLENVDENSSFAGTPEMIIQAGYPVEEHEITTEDGYILTLHRIPRNDSSKPVFLQHGLLGSSSDWIIIGKEKALAYLLYERGYDVWLGNARGNTYSRKHKNLSIKNKKFWDFSFHEMGVYDLPAAITYIHNKKKEKISYIGHSMGTTMFYVFASELPQFHEIIDRMISLAPVAYVNHMKSPIRFVAPFANNIQWILQNLGDGEFLPQSKFLKILSKLGCELDVDEERICANSIFLICGFDKQQFNYTLLPVILDNSPAGTSTKTLAHYAQEIVSQKYRQYDYGAEKNMKIYDSPDPPNYNLTAIQIPIALFYSENDWLASIIDVKRLSEQLPNVFELYKVNFTKFNHLDFIFGIDAQKLLYTKVVTTLEKKL